MSWVNNDNTVWAQRFRTDFQPFCWPSVFRKLYRQYFSIQAKFSLLLNYR